MRRAVLIGMGLALLGAGFYVAWPAWSARRIAQAIEAEDTAALERSIDFPRVRASVRPIAQAQVQQSIEKLQKEAGPLGSVIAGTLNKSLGPQLADAAVNSILTPANVIAMVRQGTDLRRAIDQAAGRDLGRGSGRGGSATGTDRGEAPAAPPARARRKLGLDNIKSYRITGPLSLAVGIARDPAAAAPDLTVDMAFTAGTWKVVGLAPRL